VFPIGQILDENQKKNYRDTRGATTSFRSTANRLSIHQMTLVLLVCQPCNLLGHKEN
jgi:hypothetical protein